jgi:signal transduction histidine kinase
MTFSYIWVAVASVLVLEILAYGFLVLSVNTFVEYVQLTVMAQRPAAQYAQAVSLLSSGAPLHPHSASVVSQPDLLIRAFETTQNAESPTSQNLAVIPVITTRYPDTKAVPFVLLIAPNQQIIDSSYSARYPAGVRASQLVFDQNHLIENALHGTSGSQTSTTAGGRVASVAETIWGNHHPIGAIYLEIPLSTTGMPTLAHMSLLFLLSALLLLLLIAPFGGFFGMITTHPLVRRLHSLAEATMQFANGNYSQQLNVSKNDEVSQLEGVFNFMARQLTESIAQRELLAEQNARLAERTRISRELHDTISQDLFPLRLATEGLQGVLLSNTQAPVFQPYIEMLQEATTRMTREMRALLLELRPLQLEHLGLKAALEELAAAYHSRLGITVTATISSIQLSTKVEHALLRIIQEAFTNAVRHAYATAITLCLQPTLRDIECYVVDNGKGFTQTDTTVQRGLGLRLMKERVQELGGNFALSTAPGQGTEIHIQIPQEGRYDQSSDR